MIQVIRAATLCLLVANAGVAASQETATPAPRTNAVRVFLDCSYCDETYFRREITFVDYVRDRKDADVHILVTTQQTGGGGTDYTIKFIGLTRFAGVDQTLKYLAPQTATSDETRKGIAEVLKRGLVRYVSETPLARRLKITYDSDAATASAAQTNDPWNLWVFRTNFGGSFNGEQTSKSRSIRASASANRTTDAWRVSFSSSMNYRSNLFELSPTDTFRSVSRSLDASVLSVKSLTQHWSAGLVGDASASTFRNYDMRVRVAPGLEYNFFPYSQSTRRMLTLQYTLGADSHDYKEETVFGKLKDKLIDHRLGTSLSLRQPWGTTTASVDLSEYLSDMHKYSVSAFGAANIRLFKGFSFNVFTNLSRTRDQIYLRRGEASTEEILVRQRQLATGYQYFLNFGISYSFGSIFNNIVNPRFGGGGGDFFFFE
jgi:hypothetical protein